MSMRSRRLLGLRAKKSRDARSTSPEQQDQVDHKDQHKLLNQWIQMKPIEADNSEDSCRQTEFFDTPCKRHQSNKRPSTAISPKNILRLKSNLSPDIKRSKSCAECKSKESYNNVNFDSKEESLRTISLCEGNTSEPLSGSVATFPNHPTLRRLAKNSTGIAATMTNTNRATQTTECDKVVQHNNNPVYDVHEMQCGNCSRVQQQSTQIEKLSWATLEDVHDVVFLMGQETLLDSTTQSPHNMTENNEDDSSSIVGQNY